MSTCECTDQLLDTRRAFDSVAHDYDGPRGNNALIKRMRAELWRTVERLIPNGSHLLDVGCGTGIDAVHFAARGFSVLATDWSPAMVERTRERVTAAGLEDRVSSRAVGVHELDRLSGQEFDCIYSDLGPLNCAPDLESVARDCASLLCPGGVLVASVIGRICPWEIAYYTARGNIGRALLRFRPVVPVPLDEETVWTRYYTPRALARAFKPHFTLESYRGLSVLLPPPYLIHAYERSHRTGAVLGRLDDWVAPLPPFRNMGDHFLVVLRKR